MITTPPNGAGTESIVDAYGCDPDRLASRNCLAAIVDRLIADLRLNTIGEACWHVFGTGQGITGLIMLSESHLALHTFPERRFAAFNLYHCGAEAQWPWEARLIEALGAESVSILTIRRGAATGPRARASRRGRIVTSSAT
jgi:S-adenosylmethionine decarboxylase proenzyme